MKLGSNDIGSVYIGSTAVNKIYIGSTEVWSAANPLLDDYPGAAAAYSLRLLSSTYSGDSIRVRRASDNAESDIGFVSGQLDTSTLEIFCSGTDGFVTTWYDQSGNGYNATQSTAASQPKIISGGSVITENGKPSLSFDGSNTILSNTSFSIDETIDLSGIIVTKANDTTTDQFIIASVNVSSNRHAIGIYNTGVFSYQKRATTIQVVSGIADTNQNLLFAINNPSLYINNVLGTSGSTILFNARNTDNVFFIGCNSSTGSNKYNGNIQEIVYWQENQSSNRTNIETNINNFYNIYE